MIRKGKIFVVGIGPGSLDHMSKRAETAICQADVVIGYKIYIDLIRELIPEKEIIDSGMRKEVERCQLSLTKAIEGKTVALISSGDAGVYGMAGIMLEIVEEQAPDLEVEIVPGITALSAAAAILGAPIMHDFAVISLSDLLTDWQTISKRLACAAQGDFVIALYNPKSKSRVKQIAEAVEIMLQYKSGKTPVGIVKNATREGEKAIITDLEHLLENDIDMFSIVIIGNSCSFSKTARIITPRGYRL